ncbi:hypothetical protein APSETT444_002689, partial [Aspergillus pseudonomiae]
ILNPCRSGVPKEIVLPHGYFSALDYFQYIPLPQGRKSTAPWLSHPDHPHLIKTNMFHATGIVTWAAAIFHRTHFVLGPDAPLTPGSLKAIVSETGAKSGLFLPDTLTCLSASEEGLAALASLECVSFVGMPLPPSAGDKIARATRLQSSIGLTEAGYFCSLQPRDPMHWEYFEWNCHHPMEMRDHPSGCSELVITRPPDYYTHTVFLVLPNREEFCTGDLFVQHSDHKELWRHVGRKDDVSKLQNRVFLHPGPIERALEGHELVSKAMFLIIINDEGRTSPCRAYLRRFLAPFGYQSRCLLGEAPWDVVNLRMGSGSVVSWPLLYKRIWSTLRPDGWIEQWEIDFEPRSDIKSLNDTPLYQWYQQTKYASAASGHPIIHCARQTQMWLRQAGFKAISHQEIALPLNQWNQVASDTGAVWYAMAYFEIIESIIVEMVEPNVKVFTPDSLEQEGRAPPIKNRIQETVKSSLATYQFPPSAQDLEWQASFSANNAVD